MKINHMEKSFFYFIVFSLVSLASCIDKDSLENSFLQSLSIDQNSTTFIDANGLPYIENILVSQQDSHLYRLSMEKGINYRITTSQPESEFNQTKITLVNILGDTLAESLGEDPRKASIVLKSPETSQYYVIVRLTKRTNPQFIYRLFFESIEDKEIVFGGQQWMTDGIWDNSSGNSLSLQNSDSHMYRHLKLAYTELPTTNVSFRIRNTGDTKPNFGLVLNGTDDYAHFYEYSSQIPTGTGFLTEFTRDLFCIYKSVGSGVGYRWGELSVKQLDFQNGVQVDLKFENNDYWIYIDGKKRDWMGCQNFFNFYILVEDAGNDKTIIDNLIFSEE